MHDFDGGALPWQPPFTLGHENAGWVHSVGAGVSGVEPGEPVAVYGPWGCGTCSRCRLGIETLCERPSAAPVPSGGGGLGLDGGMADYLLVPNERFLVPLPPGLTPAQAAPLTDAGLTPYHAVRRSWPKVNPQSWVVVFGVGGLGHLAVQIAKATTSGRVVAVDVRPEALELAVQMGADETYLMGGAGSNPSEQIVDDIRALTGGIGADLVLDFVGNDQTMAAAMAVSRSLGDVTIVGIGGGSFDFSFMSQPYEVSLQTTYWGSRSELEEVLALAARGELTPRVHEISLDEAAAGYRDLAAGRIEGRLVVVP